MPQWISFSFFLRFLGIWCGSCLKYLLNLLQYCFCFMFCFVLFFWPRDMWDPSSLTRDQTPCIRRWCFNHGPPGKYLTFISVLSVFYLISLLLLDFFLQKRLKTLIDLYVSSSSFFSTNYIVIYYRWQQKKIKTTCKCTRLPALTWGNCSSLCSLFILDYFYSACWKPLLL